MPLQSGIIVVEKPPTVISTAGTPVSTTVVSQQQQQKISAPKTNQIYEYYETTQGVASNSGSGTTTLNNIIRRQKKLSGSSSSIQHYDSNQHGPVQILTEEYLEQTTTTPSGTVINITPNDLMNQTRFIKFVNADNTTNVIIDSSNGPQNSNVSSNQSNGLPPNSSHVNTSGTTSKVLVSNLTVLKQHQQNVAAGQQQHIGLINSKDLSYVTTSGKNIQKIVNIPVKTTVGGVQKVTIPRNVQVVTRIPTNLDGSNQNSTSSGQQILVQPKYISHNVVAGNNNNLTLIKKQGGGALKIQTKLNTGIKNTYFQTSAQAQQQPQTLYVQQTTTTTSLTPPKVKSQKILKQFNNAINNNTSTVSVATLGGSKQLQHHQQHQGTGTTKKHPKYNLVQNQHYTTSNIVSTIPPGTKINTIMPSDHFNNAATATGTIKFVNAQGNVIQQQSLPIQRNSSHTSVPQQPQTQQVIKFTSPNKHLIENSSPSSEDGSSSIYKIGNFVQTSNASNVVATSTSKVSVPHRGEEVMIVNGTQMTDEYSARILQQMAQKSYQQQHHQQQQQQHVVKQKPVVSTSMPPPQPVHQQVHQQNSSASIFSSPPKTSPRYVNKVSLERKEVVKKVLDTDYFRINSNEVKPTYTTTTVPVPSTLKPTIETTFVDNIPLPLPTKTEIKQEPEEIIGEEVRPVPLDTIDVIQQRLYAIHQDHTYHSNSLTASELHKLQASSIKTEKSSNSFILYGQNHQDDDANSVISNGSRSGALENDLGEETETAPEAEAEDDSVTRCICDFTHDDGYMICCDKCSCWQHVDCMGIDRQNIPEEYLCEQCQPRSVDKLRARNLQTVKRKEQQQLLLNTQFNNSNVGGNGVLGPGVPTTIYQPQGDTKILLPSPHLGSANSTSSLNSLVSPPPIGKKSTKLTKKKEFIKKSKKDKIVGGKKRENTKKISKKKNRSGGSVGDTAAEKHAANLRQWIENYEVAVTNHYSPELRARLHAINKQTTLVNSSQNYNYLENAVSIIPHAGGKIVIANFEIQPNTPIIELMGKYMLSTQYKNQNPSKNMNSPWPPTNYLQSLKYMYKIPGPFIFFYQWTMDSLVSESNELTALNLNTVNGPEVCVDTRTYGNDARFVRRSCRPNACLKHTFVNGSIHLYIVALTKIMASTEITIRHEPHDLLAIENKQLMAANPAYQNFSVQPTSTSCACGLIKECVFGVQTKPIKEEKSNKVNKKKMLQANPNANNRNRSTSSSGESNSGVAVSPNNNILASTNNALTSLTTNVLHDSGVYTSSSSPSVSIPSPSQQLQANTNIQSQNQLPSAPVLTPTIVPVVESQISNEPLSVESSSLSNPQESQPQMQPHLLDQPIQQQQSQPQSQQPPTQKVARTPKKSISESNDVNPAADSKENSPNKAKTEEKRESRKLTRDERKLEAIVRAIEKMEKNQQKKQDSKYSKRATSGSPSPKRSKLNSSSESGGDCKIRKKKKTKNMQKGCGMPSKKSKSLKKNPLKKQFSGNDSDVFNTSEESLLSPIPPQHQTSHVDDDDNLNKAADLLLAFAKNDIKTEPSHEEQTRNASTPISSNCLLVEAAVGPIDQDNNFKLPISQAKTKKTMMNNWFNQNEYALHIPCMDSPKSPGYDSPLASPSMALKKVEEFITQADGIQNLQQPSLQQVVSPQTTNQHPSTLQIQGVSTCANNSSVKKRWLRQAISEESETVSDSMTTPTTPTVPTPTTPITPNGFMTPLKKRRLLIDTSPVEISHDIKEEIEDPQQPPLSPKIEVKHEEAEEVDIIRSPSPGSRKIVVEDNQVKIEPEDPGSEEMQVDVEKEEVDDVKEIKEEIVIKQEIKEENNLEDILHSFHKENLLNLEARNREKKSALGDEKKTIKKEKKEKKKIKKKKKSKFSDSEEKNDKRKLSCSSTSSTLSSISILSNEVPPPQFDVPPIVTTPLPLPPPPPLPASIARIETPPPMTTTTLPPPPQSEVRAISTLPYYNTIYSKFNSFMDHHPVVSSSPRPPSPIACSILTPDYLDAKLKSYNSLGGFVSQRTSSLLGGLSIEINGSQSPTTSSTSMAINNTPVATSKPFTKTASHDPRLNPQLTAPEPAPTPKRKLSINEYRKRKQLSSESNAVNSTETSKVTEDPKDLPVPEQIEANLATDEIQIVKGLLSPNEMSSDENFEQQEQFEPETNNFEPETSTTVNSNINNNNDSTTTNFCSPNKTTTTTTSSTNATSTTTTTSSPVSSP